MRPVVAVFAATVNVTVPLPDPVALPVMVIQAALVVAVQAHPAAVVIENDPLVPATGTACSVGAIAYEHEPVAAACVTETVWPAIMIAPVRWAVVVFGATVKVRVPFPASLVAPVSVIHGVLVNELHAHPAAVVIVTEPVPPAAGTDCDIGLRLYVQLAPEACVTVNV